jgi:DNA-binding CsgD family transcriptional regulator
VTTVDRNFRQRLESARREVEVLHLVALGATNGEIARELNMAERTVKKYCSRLYEKHGISDLSPYGKRARLATLVADRERSGTAAELDPMEKTIAKWVTSGRTNAEIGAVFGKTRWWVVSWLREIYEKTGMGNRTELALWSVAKLGGNAERRRGEYRGR